MSRARVMQCPECYGLSVVLLGVGTGRKPVPGTGRLDCGHLEVTEVGEVAVVHLVNVALGTLLRRPDMLADRDMAARLQEWLRASPEYRFIRGLPWDLTDGDYGVSTAGLATARILARLMAAQSGPPDSVMWSAAARIMRVRMY